MIPFAKQFIFLLWGPIWTYDKATGKGMRRVAYNPFTDFCTVRVSQFGAVTGFEQIERVVFERACEESA